LRATLSYFAAFFALAQRAPLGSGDLGAGLRRKLASLRKRRGTFRPARTARCESVAAQESSCLLKSLNICVNRSEDFARFHRHSLSQVTFLLCA
jgi:hypothetical protein